MNADLKNKVVIVTGGAKGIGAGCVARLLDAGAQIAIFDLDSVSSDKTFNLKVDVSKESDVEKAVGEVVAKFGKIDGLVNCAGIQTYGSATETSVEVWDKTFDEIGRAHV